MVIDPEIDIRNDSPRFLVNTLPTPYLVLYMEESLSQAGSGSNREQIESILEAAEGMEHPPNIIRGSFSFATSLAGSDFWHSVADYLDLRYVQDLVGVEATTPSLPTIPFSIKDRSQELGHAISTVGEELPQEYVKLWWERYSSSGRYAPRKDFTAQDYVCSMSWASTPEGNHFWGSIYNYLTDSVIFELPKIPSPISKPTAKSTDVLNMTGRVIRF